LPSNYDMIYIMARHQGILISIELKTILYHEWQYQ